MQMRTLLLNIVTAILLLTVPVFVSAQTEEISAETLAAENGHFVDVDGAKVYYETSGSTDNPAVVLVHGFGGSTHNWRFVTQPLADAGFYVVALDLPPFGLSDKSIELDYSHSWMADLVAGLLDELSINTATIVGHSMGGSVTAQFAVRHPQRVDKLVFVAGGILDQLMNNREGSIPILDSIDPESPAAAMLLRAIFNDDFFTDTLSSAYNDETALTNDVRERYAQLVNIEGAPAGFIAFLQADEASPITLDDLASAAEDMPVLLLWGEEDSWVPLSLGQTMHDALNNSELITYPDVGHLPPEEVPEQFSRDLINFLQR